MDGGGIYGLVDGVWGWVRVPVRHIVLLVVLYPGAFLCNMIKMLDDVQDIVPNALVSAFVECGFLCSHV